jgi:hypothetical protein
MTIKFYQVLNYFFPDGLNKNRKFYKKDLDTISKWISNINKEYGCDISINDKGIILFRDKKFKLSNIKKYMPPISSYILTH